MMFELLSGNKQMLPQIMAIERQSFSDPWSEKSMQDELEHPDGIFLVATSDSGVLGFIAVRNNSGAAELMRIAADLSCRRLGVGRALLDEAERRCIAQGILLMNLDVEENNLPAIGLYKNVGFETVGRRPGYYGDTAAILMTKVF